MERALPGGYRACCRQMYTRAAASNKLYWGSEIASISIADKNVRSPIDAGLLIAAWQKYTHCNEWSETFPMVVGKAVCCSCSLRYPPRSASHKQQSAQFQEVLGLAICVASSISPSLAMANGSPRTHWKEWSELFPVDIVLAVVKCTPVQQLAAGCIGGHKLRRSRLPTKAH